MAISSTSARSRGVTPAATHSASNCPRRAWRGPGKAMSRSPSSSGMRRERPASFTAHHAIAIGALFVVSVIFFPKGLVGYLAPALQRWRSKRA